MRPVFRIGNFILTQAEVDKRKAYLGITAADEQRLREAHPVLKTHAGEVIERFYDFLLSHDHTKRMLSAPGLIERLKGYQQTYFEELTAGDYGIAYFENRLRVGQTHERVGLSPEWYLGAYNQYLQIVLEILGREFGKRTKELILSITSLAKVIHLDMSLSLDAYIFSAQESLERKNVALEESYTREKKLREAKQQLTDMIVHDLQNPMAGLQAFLQVLSTRRERLEAGEREALDEALQRCSDLSQMVMNVLQVSRAEAGRLEIYTEDVDLTVIARSTLAMFEGVAKRDGRTLRVEAPATVPTRTDQALLRRMAANLVRNALRHTPAGTSVVIRAESGAGGAILSVIDDGPGIPPELHPLLFQPFGAPTLREHGLRVDSGLGLAFCKSAADAVGATLIVESDGKRGTRFSIVLKT